MTVGILCLSFVVPSVGPWYMSVACPTDDSKMHNKTILLFIEQVNNG